MPQVSLRDQVIAALKVIHQKTELGRTLDKSGVGVVITPNASPAEVIEFLLDEVTTFETLLVRIASEVDALRAA